VNKSVEAVDFLGANLPANSAPVEHLAGSWDLVPSGSAEPHRVTEEQVAIADVKIIYFLLFPCLFSSFLLIYCVGSSLGRLSPGR